MCRYSANQHLLVLKLDSVPINKILVTDFAAAQASQNLIRRKIVKRVKLKT